MNIEAIVKSFEDAIIDAWCEAMIINSEDNAHMIGKTDEGYIDIEKTWQNGREGFYTKDIKQQLNYFCDYTSIYDIWQQTALDILSENELSEDEFNRLENSEFFKLMYGQAFNNVINSLS